ncbi:hypothetical protein [Prauserella alba]|uniref:DUF1795 domain-containing protein n=1 Tax=Prauserella alba TaxID=176898 RepID=A0ABN1VQL1_9PSEU|nr:hypothetical protein [Prauserella alba]MCP2179507.1 hypothetical protein [Prauserella alba]
MLPVPIEFTLPDGWRSVPPERTGAPDVEFLAVHPGSSAGFTATIAVTGRVREDGAGLDELADESARSLAEHAVAVKVGRRERSGDETSGSLTQALGLRVRTGGELTDLAQLRTFLTVPERTGTGRLLVVDVVLTATPTQLAELIADFQAFVGGIRPDLSGSRRRPAPPRPPEGTAHPQTPHPQTPHPQAPHPQAPHARARPPAPRLPPHSPPRRPGRHRREP